MGHKAILTTWEAGRYCGVSPYTVRNWIRAGRLPAYTTPGGHRRIRRQDLDSFLLSHGMPLPSDFKEGNRRVLLLLSDGAAVAGEMESWSHALDVRSAPSAFAAGVDLLAFDPHLLVVDLDEKAWDGLGICRRVHETPEAAHIQLAAVCRAVSVDVLEAAEKAGALACFARPLDMDEVRRFLRRLFPYCPWNSPPG